MTKIAEFTLRSSACHGDRINVHIGDIIFVHQHTGADASTFEVHADPETLQLYAKPKED